LLNFGTRGVVWGEVDRVVGIIIFVLAQGKFWRLFAFLFGLGFALQLGRAERRGLPFLPAYARRLLFLFLLGLAHVPFYFGDILHMYAVLGAALLLFRRRSSVVVLAAAAVCLLARPTHSAVGARGGTEGQVAVEMPAEAQARWLEERARVHAEGSLLEVLSVNVEDFRRTSSSADRFLWGTESYVAVFTFFLLGLWAGRRRVYEWLPHRRRLLRRLGILGFAGGVLGTGVHLAIVAAVPPESWPAPEWSRVLLRDLSFALGAPALSLAYVAGVALLAGHDRWRDRLAPLGAVGRTALSNYLLQSLIFTTIFYGTGRGHLRDRGGRQRLVASTVPLRAHRVAVADSNLWKAAADAALACGD
jgi:uncharacterized protein